MELPIGNKHELEIKYQNLTAVRFDELPFKASQFTVEGRMFEVTATKASGRVTITMREPPRQLGNQ